MTPDNGADEAFDDNGFESWFVRQRYYKKVKETMRKGFSAGYEAAMTEMTCKSSDIYIHNEQDYFETAYGIEKEKMEEI